MHHPVEAPKKIVKYNDKDSIVFKMEACGFLIMRYNSIFNNGSYNILE